MKKKLTVLIIFSLIVLFHYNLLGQTQIISVSKDPLIKADYKELQNAIDSAANGSTIYVYPGNYNGFTITNKHFTIIGPGYFLSENPQTQANPFSAFINSGIVLETFSDGTILQGLNINSQITIQNTNGVLIQKNRIPNIEIHNSSSILIKLNYISMSLCGAGVLHVGNNCGNINILNNWIENTVLSCGPWTQSNCITTELNSICNVKNNTLFGNLNGNTIYLENNIFRGGSNYGCSNCIYDHNVSFDVNAFGITNGNDTLSMSRIFIGTGSTDGKWQVKSDSPAKHMASDGGEVGMFGGSEPYVLSGMPSIPSIYYFNAPIDGNIQNDLPIHIKVKSH